MAGFALDKTLRTAIYVLINIGLLGAWLIALAGVSALQEKCHTPGFGGCRQRLGLPWWVIWFEFVAIGVVAAVQFIPSLGGGNLVAIAFLAILTTLQMILADQALDIKNTTQFKKRANVETAGWILLAIFNLLLIMVMSSHPVTTDDDHDYNMGGGKHGPPPATPGAHPMRPMSSRSQSNMGNSYGTTNNPTP